jgi:hypothetical protein
MYTVLSTSHQYKNTNHQDKYPTNEKLISDNAEGCHYAVDAIYKSISQACDQWTLGTNTTLDRIEEKKPASH